MEKAFMLRWEAHETRVHSSGEWQLRFKDGASYDFANKHLPLAHWLSVKKSPDDETLFSFIDDGARLSAVLQNLHAAGISSDQIEIDPSAQGVAAGK